MAALRLAMPPATRPAHNTPFYMATQAWTMPPAAAAPIKSRSALDGVGTAIMDGVIGVTEILRVQDAARRLPYPYAPPTLPCP